jgi:hypothetical protein
MYRFIEKKEQNKLYIGVITKVHLRPPLPLLSLLQLILNILSSTSLPSFLPSLHFTSLHFFPSSLPSFLSSFLHFLYFLHFTPFTPLPSLPS